MTLAAHLANTWLAASLFVQIGSIPIWVPLSIILLIILLFWWGLTRNRSPDEDQTTREHEAAEEELETAAESAVPDEELEIAAEPPVPDEELETAAGPAVPDEELDEDTTDEPASDIEEAEHAPAEAEESQVPSEPDDLKVIEGIGPKISAVLAEASIITYAQLASTDPEQLNKIVREDAGIKIANPASWPEQADLAASGDWDGLEKLQKRLVAGRHPD